MLVTKRKVWVGRHVRGHVWRLFGLVPVWRRLFW